MFENLGNKLRFQREKNGMNRQQVADLVGISKSMIGLYETSDRLPSLPVLVKLAAQYKVSVDYLLDTEPTNNDTINLSGLSFEQKQSIKTIVNDLKNSKTDF